MVLLITTTRILSAIESIPSSCRKDLNFPDSLDLNSPISHDQLIRLAQYLHTAQKNDGSWSLNSLLKGTKVYVPPPPKKPEPSPEYLASKARLLAAAEADAYNRLMTPSTSSTQAPSPIFTTSTSSPETSEPEYADPLTPSLVLNIFLSVVITGFSVYWALTSFQTPEFFTSSVLSAWGSKNRRGASEPVKVLVSFVVALVVGVAEVFLYAAYLRKVELARGREKKMKERKNGTTQEVKIPGGDQEEIWGKGANGGVRRRVRERWEEREKEKGEQDGSQ
ncbi:hypothetical protein ASPWEDRAFT_353485 [Aspergillus wentii DTO 134E9]|uniref:Endoplasmic reticulum-based factor for assembly of V-ATPase n=1 Tax=Aspergillus wentii DTO 134E9 TaxID=1073089 RepID=A0A1L9RVV0_ASPWE|nr:uncharacterized protein ASPWEDRAFT_353485 [Aspergillus wentii DTO 134E9]OJJ39056.1 hypothetical protein ASPWEDRAFT_353485 [Aspergillus wentii DTO 134E9]